VRNVYYCVKFLTGLDFHPGFLFNALPVYKVGARIYCDKDELHAWMKSQRTRPGGFNPGNGNGFIV
jgi:hypothetical protein